jgi:putative ABC transport system permease protein
VRIRPGDINQTLGALKTTWSKFSQDSPFSYEFLNSDFEGLYQSEQRMGSVFGLFTFLSLFIACLGLFGLSAYTAERRTKEIGIRKVLGATVTNVTALLSKDFIKLIVVAILIATPTAWWAMNRWLNDFAYRTPMNVWVFIAAGSIALSIALFTVSFQSIKAAIVNPVKSLRSE